MTGGSARRLILAAAAGLWACAQPPSAVLIRDVTVIAGDGRVIPRADVLVEGDRVARIDSASAATAPAGTRVIDGSGRFLVPGLFEMHAHTSKTRASALGLYVANGVTTIRDMGGDHEAGRAPHADRRALP
jgi:imidazolonepropionase-like amidohydrolase